MSESAVAVASGPVLSVVAPLLNEEEVLLETHRRLNEVMTAIGEPFEIIFVDDGSTDRSRLILIELSATHPEIRVVGLSRNFGHEMATTAGLHHARGQAAIVIDADLQDPPEVIPEFVRLWRDGCQVVYGVRKEREGETALKKFTAFIFYRLMAMIGDLPIPADTGDFRLLDRRVIEVFRQLNEDPRFFRGMITWVGFKQVGVPFVRQPRLAGYSKYRYGRLLRLAFDTITAFSTYPALLITVVAGSITGLSILLFLVVVAASLVGWIDVPAWGWVAFGFLALWNIQFGALAVFGEYLVRTHRHTQRRPLYIVDAVFEKGTIQR